MNRFFYLISVLASIPKSLYVCFNLLPLKQAVTLPILVRYNTRICSLRGGVKLKECRYAVIKFGFGQVDHLGYRSSLRIDGTAIFKGSAFFGQDTTLSVGQGSIIEFGKHFTGTGGLLIYCHHHMTIGEDCLVSWNTQIFDTDFHAVKDLSTGNSSNIKNDVFIGEKVWICSNVTVLKGSNIGDGCIVGSSTLVNHSLKCERNCLISGNPARVTRKNIEIFRN